jgi:hypothetical protein
MSGSRWILVMVVVLLVGCKGKSSPSPATKASPPESPAPAAPAAGSTAPQDDACAYFTRDLAKDVLGVEVTGPEHLQHIDGQTDSCRWTSAADKHVRVTGTISTHGYSREEFLKQNMEEFKSSAKEVGGLGEAAILLSEGSMSVLNVYLPKYTLLITSSASEDKVEAAAKKFVAAVPAQ